MKTTIQTEIPMELNTRALNFVQEGWANNMDDLIAEALRRFLESHSTQLTETLIMKDVQWGLHGSD
jgi:cellobiose-specific phosphotransferase system component IIA